jgi:hypothetical protein
MEVTTEVSEDTEVTVDTVITDKLQQSNIDSN